MLDLLIRGADVVDGTGAPRRRADVGVRDGRVVAIGDTVDEPAARVVDADGLVLCPGFVDIHTHYDAQVFWDPACTPSPFHGVTTVVGGNCGFTIAPLEESETDYITRMLARVEGMPLESLQAAVPYDWRTFGEYLDRIDGTLAVNAGLPRRPLRDPARRDGRGRGRQRVDPRAARRDEAAPRRVARRRRARLLVVAGADAQRRRRRPGAVAQRRPATSSSRCAASCATTPARRSSSSRPSAASATTTSS